MTLQILSKQFFSDDIFHLNLEALSPKDQRNVLISGIFLAIIILGIFHLVRLINRNRTFKLAAVDDPVPKKVQRVAALHVGDNEKLKANQRLSPESSKNDLEVAPQNKPEGSSLLIQRTGPGSTVKGATKDTGVLEEKTLEVPQRLSPGRSKNDQEVAPQNKPEGSSLLIQPTDPGSTVKGTTKDASVLEEETLDALIKFAKREDDAFLIDFSKVKPSNIFKIFNEGTLCNKVYGDVGISDNITYDESDKFTQNFPYKYSIRIVTIEKNKHGYNSSTGYMFTMSYEGKVESYGRVFNNFNEYIDYKMTSTYEGTNKCTFKHFDFHSVMTSNGHKKLRKKSLTANFN